MRSIITIVIGLFVALLVAFLLTVIADAIPRVPGWVDTIIWVAAILAWLAWAFGGFVDRRVV